jgi:hypothetical protein
MRAASLRRVQAVLAADLGEVERKLGTHPGSLAIMPNSVARTAA